MPLKIISVTGAHSKVGKTTLCSILLQNLPGFGAIKFTKSPVYVSITDDPEKIMQKDKDTAKMSESGAEKVVWIQSPGNELEDALTIALGKMKGLPGVVVEGNSPVKFISPLLTIFIIGQDGQIKPSAVEVGKKADVIIINSGGETEKKPVQATLLQENTPTFRIDLIKKQGEIDKFISYVKEYIKE